MVRVHHEIAAQISSKGSLRSCRVGIALAFGVACSIQARRNHKVCFHGEGAQVRANLVGPPLGSR